MLTPTPVVMHCSQEDPWYGVTWRVPKPERSATVVCTRCFGLRNYGTVDLDAETERLMPTFDFNKDVGEKLRTLKHKTVVVVVVDLVDFDGSFPRQIIPTITDSGAEVTPLS